MVAAQTTLTLIASLSLILTALSFPLEAEEDAQAKATTTTVEGLIKVSKDRSGAVSMVAVQTPKGNLLVPTKDMGSFVGYEGKKVKVFCAIEGKNIVPRCVTGIVQAQKVPAPGKVH
jgi:hypothetical protein